MRAAVHTYIQSYPMVWYIHMVLTTIQQLAYMNHCVPFEGGGYLASSTSAGAAGLHARIPVPRGALSAACPLTRHEFIHFFNRIELFM
jgi:hypothetical protein